MRMCDFAQQSCVMKEQSKARAGTERKKIAAFGLIIFILFLCVHLMRRLPVASCAVQPLVMSTYVEEEYQPVL